MSEGAEGSHLHLTSDRAWIARPGGSAADTANAPAVWLHTANARVTQWQRTQQGQRTDFTLQGQRALQFSVAGMAPPAS